MPLGPTPCRTRSGGQTVPVVRLTTQARVDSRVATGLAEEALRARPVKAWQSRVAIWELLSSQAVRGTELRGTVTPWRTIGAAGSPARRGRCSPWRAGTRGRAPAP